METPSFNDTSIWHQWQQESRIARQGHDPFLNGRRWSRNTCHERSKSRPRTYKYHLQSILAGQHQALFSSLVVLPPLIDITQYWSFPANIKPSSLPSTFSCPLQYSDNQNYSVSALIPLLLRLSLWALRLLCILELPGDLRNSSPLGYTQWIHVGESEWYMESTFHPFIRISTYLLPH